MLADAYCFGRSSSSLTSLAAAANSVEGLEVVASVITGPDLRGALRTLSSLEPTRLRSAIALVEVSANDTVAFEPGYPVGPAAALVLGFPEVFFQFVSSDPFVELPPQQLAAIDRLHDALSSGYWRVPAIFDPWGLRSALKPAHHRPSLACVGDEESAYCYLNALAAYRAGFRVAVIQTAATLDTVQRACGDGRCQLVLADRDLAFVDTPSADAVDVFFRRLWEMAPEMNRCVISRSAQDELRGLPLIRKPYQGVYALLNSTVCSVLKDQFTRWRSPHHGLPPPDPVTSTRSTHSAGPLASVAEALLDRSRSAMASAAAVEDLVYAAILALEAKELAGRSRTLALEALAIMHRAELLAECESVGTTAVIDVSARFNDLEDEVDKYVMADEPARSHFLEKAASQLRAVCRGQDQSEAVDESLRRTAKYSEYRHVGLKKLATWYADKVTDCGTSANRLTAVSVTFVLLFAVFYWGLFVASPLTRQHCLGVSTPCLGLAIGHSLLTSLELSPGMPEVLLNFEKQEVLWKWGFVSVLILQLTVTLVHVGLLIFILQRRLIRSSA